jgi:integrase
LILEPSGWRLRSRSKVRPMDFRTGTLRLDEAKRSAKEWLARLADDPVTSRRGGGTLEALAAIYLKTPKRTQDDVAADNVSRLKTVCRAVFGRELAAVTCRQVGPEFWEAYQRVALAKKKLAFDLVTRRRENIAINSAVRAARCLFLPALVRVYRAEGLDVRQDAGSVVMLPEPYVPPSAVNDAALRSAWVELKEEDPWLWATIGLARFAGLRRDEIAFAKLGWIEQESGAVFIALRDRPEDGWWTKTGKPYRAQVINLELANWLLARDKTENTRIIPAPERENERARWFEKQPQAWLRTHGVPNAGKPLHRLRGLYADEIARLTADAVTARLAALRAAQEALGHTSAETTQNHYLDLNALR